MKVETETVAFEVVVVAGVVCAVVLGVAELDNGGVAVIGVEDDDRDDVRSKGAKTSEDGSDGGCFEVVGAVSSLKPLSSSYSSEVDRESEEVEEEVEEEEGAASNK